MQCWNWSSRQQASLITNHMHVADFNYSSGKLLAAYRDLKYGDGNGRWG